MNYIILGLPLDGGYYSAKGMKVLTPSLFTIKNWGKDTVLEALPYRYKKWKLRFANS